MFTRPQSTPIAETAIKRPPYLRLVEPEE